MPRQAPTQVIEHRISLQDAERNAILPLVQDVRDITQKAAFTSEVATYGALALGGVGLVYVPQLWAYVKEREGGFGLPGDTFGERFKWLVRWSPAGILTNLLNDVLGLTRPEGGGEDNPSPYTYSWWEDLVEPFLTGGNGGNGGGGGYSGGGGGGF